MDDVQQIVVDLRPLSTDREHCLSLDFEPSDGAKLEQAEIYRFDQQPVLDRDGRLCGLVGMKDTRSTKRGMS